MINGSTYIGNLRNKIFSFYDYVPVRVQHVSQEVWNIRKLVWGFKSGKCPELVANLVADKLMEMFGSDVRNIVFACIPASSKQKNEIRYRYFSEIVCNLTGAQNAFEHITVEGERRAAHDKSDNVQSVETVDFDESFFKGKKVIVFDDIITRGRSYTRFSQHLQRLGAEILGGVFLGQTVLI